MAYLDDLLLADLEYRLQVGVKIQDGDHVCAEYLLKNRDRLIPTLVTTAKAYERDIDNHIARFIHGVHVRHQSGEELN